MAVGVFHSKTLKQTLKKIPFVQSWNMQLHKWRDEKNAKRQFRNPDAFIEALKEKRDGSVVLEDREGLKIKIRKNLYDARIVREIFFDKPYVRGLSLPDNPTIVDIGGYIGDFSLFAAHYLNASRVVVYEPTIENFGLLESNIVLNSFEDRITAVNKAVGNSPELTLDVDLKESDEIHVSHYWYTEGETRTVPCVTLDQLLAEHSLDSVDLLKVDCEGGEYDIFPQISDETFQKIHNIAFEYHEVSDSDAKLKRVVSRLTEAGYVLRFEGRICYATRNKSAAHPS